MAGYTLLKNALLFDGNGDSVVPDSWVLINDDRIVSVGQGNPAPPPGTKVVDVAGKTVLPGLIDTHVHTLMMGDEGLRLFIAAGVTAARDCGGRLEGVKAVQRALEAHEKLGPRLYVCGPMLQGTVQSLPEPFASVMLESVPSPDAVADKVKPLLENEVDSIKLYFSLPAETGRRIISYVGGNVPVTGHLGWMRASEAVEAGINGLEHASISPFQDICPLQHRWGPDASMMSREWGQKLRQGWEEADLAAPATRDLIANMAQRQVALGTLLSVDWMTWSGFDNTRRDADRRYIPPAVLARHRAMAEALGGGGEDWDLRLPGFGGEGHSGNPRKALEKQIDFCRLLHSAGGLIVGGTDAGGVSMPPPGFSLLRELELLAVAMGRAAALRAVTSQAARYLRKQSEVGSVAPGRFADLLVVGGDPLNDIRDLRKLTAVYKGGVEYQPAEILAGIPANPNYRPDHS
ncbi:MAG TPA: amidohydrolase family protein [Candidatus Binataceae bacterium]|jgi:imidazolonepropionase-like amidohydrolase|nr:amidohydrolase family protein [Candidatus Binataceae bacterium]